LQPLAYTTLPINRSSPMQKQERLTKTIAGEPTDRPPVALWRHFPGDDLRAADLARATIDFQRAYDWDMLVFQPADTYAVADYPLQERWEGTTDGSRHITRRAVQRSLEWTELRPLDPTRGALARHIESLRLVCEALPDTPILLTIYTALDQAAMLAGWDTLITHIRTQQDRVRSGLNILTENMLRLLETIRKFALAGVCLVASSASYNLLSEEEYRAFGLPYDRKIIDTIPQRCWLNLLRLGGDAPMFRLMSALPVHAVQWRDRETEPDLSLGKSLITGAVCAGLSAERDIYLGTPTTVRDAGRDALNRVNSRRLILSTGSPVYPATPLSNLRAVREAVELVGGRS
jgi:uroporphyrinogen decarboxylase